MYTIYSYWNANEVYDVLNAVAMIMNGSDFLGLVRAMAILGIFIAVGGAIARLRAEEPMMYIVMFALFYGILFVPKVSVTVQDVRANTVYKVDNVPIGLAVLASSTSKIGKFLTEGFETAFTAVDDERFSNTGMAFGARLIEDMQMLKIADKNLERDLIYFVRNCINPELIDNPAILNQMNETTDLWGFIGGNEGNFSLNPGRITNVSGTPLSCGGAGGAYSVLNMAMNQEITRLATKLGTQLNPQNPFANQVILSQIPQIEGMMFGASRSAQDAIKQSMALNLMTGAQRSVATMVGNAEDVQIALAVATAERSSKVSYAAMAKIAEATLPKLRNAIELITLGIFPIVFILIVAAGVKGGVVLRSYVMAILWVQLWAPLYAIINYMSTKTTARDMLGIVQGVGGNTLSNYGDIADAALSNQSIAGLLVISVPIIALAIVKGGEVAMSGVVSSVMSPAQGAAQRSGDAIGQGNVTGGNVNWGNATTGNYNSANWTSGSSSFNNTSANKHDLSGLQASAGLTKLQDNSGNSLYTNGKGDIVAGQILTSNLGLGTMYQSSDSISNADTASMQTSTAVSDGYSTAVTHRTGSADNVVSASGYSNSDSKNERTFDGHSYKNSKGTNITDDTFNSNTYTSGWSGGIGGSIAAAFGLGGGKGGGGGGGGKGGPSVSGNLSAQGGYSVSDVDSKGVKHNYQRSNNSSNDTLKGASTDTSTISENHTKQDTTNTQGSSTETATTSMHSVMNTETTTQQNQVAANQVVGNSVSANTERQALQFFTKKFMDQGQSQQQAGFSAMRYIQSNPQQAATEYSNHLQATNPVKVGDLPANPEGRKQALYEKVKPSKKKGK